MQKKIQVEESTCVGFGYCNDEPELYDHQYWR